MNALAIGSRNPIPIINVMRFRDGKVVEIWNHRHDIDTGLGNMLVAQGFAAGFVCAAVGSLALWFWRARIRPAPERAIG